MSDYSIKATLADKQAKDFFSPLNDVLRNCGAKVVIRFSKDKKISIKAITEQRNLIQYINFSDSISSLFEMDADYRTGIYDLSEFVNLFKIFEGGVEFRYLNTEKKIELFSVVNGEEHSLQYYICDESVVPKPPERVDYSKIVWITKLEWVPSKNETLLNAMKSLKYPSLILSGKKDDQYITVSITESNLKTTTFKSKVKVETPVVSNFKVSVEKTDFINIISGSIREFNIDISEKMLRFTGKSDVCDVEYVLIPLI